ncbi:MAG: hypothetical protein LBK23_11670 [Oscillospiraceae bacterium]|jgi:hypothetical protein|nr:hypothetical protein [Oscillospiraceae bacterium]
MKKAKYITGSVLLFAILILTGEVYVWHISSFSYSGYTGLSMYLQPGGTRENMLAGIAEAARENNVEVFCVDRKVENLFSERMNIYATDGAAEALASKSQIYGGSFESMLIGRTEVAMLPFADTPDPEEMASPNTYYIIGSEEDILAFRRATIDDYGGNFPHGFPDGRDTEKIYVVFLWVIAVLLLWLLTQFEIEVLKKEVVVRLINGESVGGVILKNIAADTAFFAAIPVFLALALRGVTNTFYAYDAALAALGVFWAANSLPFLRLFFVDYKRDIVTSAGARATVRAAYVFKTITAVLAVIILSANIELAARAVNFYSQRGFFEDNRGFSYVILPAYFLGENGWDDSYASEEVSEQLYGLATGRGTARQLVWIDARTLDGGYVFADRGATEYLKEKIPELRETVTEEKVYFITPKKRASEAGRLDDMREVWELYYREAYDSEALSYGGAPEIIAVTQGSRISSELVKSPMIVLNNMGADGVPGYYGIGYLQQATMYSLTAEEFDAYHTELGFPGFAPKLTGVLDNYLYQWQFEKRTLLIAAVLAALMLALESIVIRTLLRFEYRVHAAELALKKVLGYTVPGRNKRFFITTAVTGALSLTASLVVCGILGSASLTSVAAGGLALIAVELVFAAANMRRFEKRNVQRILKGEAV